MKDSPLFLLLPTLLIIGLVGVFFVEEALSPASDMTEVAEVVENNDELEIDSDTSQNVSNSADTFSSDKQSDISSVEFNQKRWLRNNLLLKEPCDFTEIKMFADALLSKPEWKKVIDEYPNRTNTDRREAQIDAVVASKHLHSCYLEVMLETNEMTGAEFSTDADFTKTWNILPLINSNENYEDGYIEVTVGEFPFSMLPADGPNGGSYGAFQYVDGENIRLIRVAHSGGGKMSYYEAEQLGQDMCPCRRVVKLWITNPISADDVQRALEEKKLPEDFGLGQ